MTDHEKQYEETLACVTKLFSDRSVSQAETKRSLGDLIGEIEVMIDTLEEDEGDEDD